MLKLSFKCSIDRKMQIVIVESKVTSHAMKGLAFLHQISWRIMLGVM